jgi:Mg2+ and Co2+ transporter CorA
MPDDDTRGGRPVDVRVLTASGVEQHPAEELPTLLTNAIGIVWVDIPSCDSAAQRVLSEVFGFHPIAVHDCAIRNRVPKVHVYSDHVFVVLHTPQRGMRGHVHYIELDQFIGPNYVVTVHGPINPLADPHIASRETQEVLHRIEKGHVRPSTPHELSYAIVSTLVRHQEAYIETLTREVWQLEQQVTGGDIEDPRDFVNKMFRARHGLLVVRTMGALSAAIYGRMIALARLSTDPLSLVADVTDQFTRVCTIADGEREYLQGVIEFYQTTLTLDAMLAGQAQNEEVHSLARAGYRQSEDVKKISAWAGIFFAPTLIGTVYGMNFVNMPELSWALGYPFALLLMVLASVTLYALFKRLDWL